MPDLCISTGAVCEYFTLQNPWPAVGPFSSMPQSKHTAVSPLWIQVGQNMFMSQRVEKSKIQIPRMPPSRTTTETRKRTCGIARDVVLWRLLVFQNLRKAKLVRTVMSGNLSRRCRHVCKHCADVAIMKQGFHLMQFVCGKLYMHVHIRVAVSNYFQCFYFCQSGDLQ